MNKINDFEYDIIVPAKVYENMPGQFIAQAYTDGKMIHGESCQMWKRDGRYLFFGATFVEGVSANTPVYVRLTDVEARQRKLDKLKADMAQWIEQHVKEK